MLVPKDNATVQEFDWGQLTWYVSGEQGNSQTMTFGQCIIKPGKENPRHVHPNCDEILHLLSGALVHSLGDQRIAMEPGDSISVPAGIAHNARATGDEPAVMMIAFSSADRQFELESTVAP